MDQSEVKHLPKVDHAPAHLDEPSRILLGAANAIETCGHLKGDLGDAKRGFCALGALVHIAPGYGKEYLTAWSRLSAAVDGNYIPGWNNARERTKDEVVSRMRAVALGHGD